jgi:hypothetical protein
MTLKEKKNAAYMANKFGLIIEIINLFLTFALPKQGVVNWRDSSGG